jgi:hypothetical protein
MKLAKYNNKLITNAESSESQSFGIGDASIVIEILRNRLYKHKIRTLVQEYICNARDAMREVNSKGNVIITAPTSLEPTFKVRDYGAGISPDRMANVFVLYGASTKRATNGQTGGFGIGAKSAWAYTDSFVIKTYIDGTLRTYLAHTGMDHNGRLDLLSTETTSEPNGTEINISVGSGDINKFCESIFRAVNFWESGFKLANLEHNVESTKLGDVLITSENLDSRIVALIDGVQYDISDKVYSVNRLDELRDLIKSTNFALIFNNGELEVSASREEIVDNSNNLKTIAIKVKQAIELIQNKLKTEFIKVKSVQDYINFCDSNSDYDHNFTFDIYKQKYNQLFLNVRHDSKYYNCEIIEYYKRGDKLHKRAKYIRSVELDLNRLYYEENDSKIALNKRIRNKLTNGGVIRLIPSNSPILNKLKTDLGIKSVKTLDLPVEIKKPKVKVTRDKSEFCLHDYTRYYLNRVHTTLSDNKKVWHYVELNNCGYNRQDLYNLALFFKINVCLVSVGTLKIIKGDKNFKSLDDLVKNYKPTLIDILSCIHLQNFYNAKHFKDIKGTNNKKLNHLVKLLWKLSQIKRHNVPSIIIETVLNLDKYKKITASIKELDQELDKYPLLENATLTKNLDDAILYINAKTGSK